MALKFLNKKGWHTGSLRNIENVWKAEQKHDAEQKKLEELRKQIHEERERAEFRQLQEQAGLVPRQERLDFLYESGLAVGKGSTEVFKALQAPSAPGEASTSSAAAASGAASSKAAVPGALFEDKPQSANDAWRKLHSDPLLLIRQKEQDALSRIKNNPVQMAMIKKSAEAEKKLKEKKEKHRKKDHKKKHHHSKSKHRRRSPQSSDDESSRDSVKRKRGHSPERHSEYRKRDRHSAEVSDNSEEERKFKTRKQDNLRGQDTTRNRENLHSEQSADHRKRDKHSSEDQNSSKEHSRGREDARKYDHLSHGHHHTNNFRGSESRYVDDRPRQETDGKPPTSTAYRGSGYHNRQAAPKLSQEEREARLREMQMNAELHEEQRWKRLKKASEQEAQESVKDKPTGGRNFLDAAQKSIYGAEKGGSSTIEESVRRRTYYLQGGLAAEEKNAFRR